MRVVAFSFPAEAQQTGKVARIGYLAVNSPSLDKQLIEAFQQGLRGLGWVNGQNITIEYRFAEGKLDQLHALVAELIALKVDVIVSAGGTPPALAAKNATATIPIVFISTSDPVASGLVSGLARPGANVTGFSNYYAELSGRGWSCSRRLYGRCPVWLLYGIRPIQLTKGHGGCGAGIASTTSIPGGAGCSRF